jgi:hypothetical protein
MKPEDVERLCNEVELYWDERDLVERRCLLALASAIESHVRAETLEQAADSLTLTRFARALGYHLSPESAVEQASLALMAARSAIEDLERSFEKRSAVDAAVKGGSDG